MPWVHRRRFNLAVSRMDSVCLLWFAAEIGVVALAALVVVDH